MAYGKTKKRVEFMIGTKAFDTLEAAKVYAKDWANEKGSPVHISKETTVYRQLGTLFPKTSIRYREYVVKPSHKRNPDILDAIRPGMRVTIVNRFGQQQSGKAVMRGPAGWVLNLGGAHGTPGIATAENIVKVSGKPSARSLFGSRIMNPSSPSANTVKGNWKVYVYNVPMRVNDPIVRSYVYLSSARAAVKRFVASGKRAMVANDPAEVRNPAIPTKWTPATVSRKGRQIQIRMGGR